MNRHTHVSHNQDLNDLLTSAASLSSEVAKVQERDRILTILNNEERDTNNSYVTFDRLRALINEGQ